MKISSFVQTPLKFVESDNHVHHNSLHKPTYAAETTPLLLTPSALQRRCFANLPHFYCISCGSRIARRGRAAPFTQIGGRRCDAQATVVGQDKRKISHSPCLSVSGARCILSSFSRLRFSKTTRRPSSKAREHTPDEPGGDFQIEALNACLCECRSVAGSTGSRIRSWQSGTESRNPRSNRHCRITVELRNLQFMLEVGSPTLCIISITAGKY